MNIEDNLPNVQLFSIRIAYDHFVYIIHFLTTGMAPSEHTTQQKKELVVKAIDFSLIAGHLYNMGLDEILRRYVPKHETQITLIEAHSGVIGGHYVGKATARKF